MSAFQKFNCFVQDMAQKVHNLNTDAIKCLFTDTLPNAADTVVNTTTTPCTVASTSNALEIAAGGGYTKGGVTPTNSGATQTAGVLKSILQPLTFTAAGAAVGPFRYVVVYNNTAGAAATRPVIGWFDYGDEVTVNDTETFLLNFDTTSGFFTVT